jgi:hypothetical protein
MSVITKLGDLGSNFACVCTYVKCPVVDGEQMFVELKLKYSLLLLACSFSYAMRIVDENNNH